MEGTKPPSMLKFPGMEQPTSSKKKKKKSQTFTDATPNSPPPVDHSSKNTDDLIS
jgi:hypothetical protein